MLPDIALPERAVFLGNPPSSLVLQHAKCQVSNQRLLTAYSLVDTLRSDTFAMRAATSLATGLPIPGPRICPYARKGRRTPHDVQRQATNADGILITI